MSPEVPMGVKLTLGRPRSKKVRCETALNDWWWSQPLSFRESVSLSTARVCFRAEHTAGKQTTERCRQSRPHPYHGLGNRHY